MRRKSGRRSSWGSIRLAGVVLLGSLPLAVTVVGCGDDEETGCPSATEELTDEEKALYRQLEVCASRVTGVTLHRDDFPRVESDPELVECRLNDSGMCVTTPRGEVVSGFYLPACDTFAVAMRLVLVHEMVHPILCGVPGLDCDMAHQSPVWQECQTFVQCPEGPLILKERLCDGMPDCAGGADEADCP